MKKNACLWTAGLLLSAACAWAQPEPPGGDDAEGPPEMSQDMPERPNAPGRQAGARGQAMGPRGQQMGPRGQMGPGAGPMGQRGPKLTQAQETELLEFIKTNAPEIHERLVETQEQAPQVFHMKLAGFWNMYKDPQAREHFVKTTRANHELRELAGQYKAASGKDKDALKEKIVKAVGVVFDLDVAQKELQIKRMQDEIASLKGKVAKRRQLKDKYVSKRVEQLTGEGEDWQW